MIEQHVVGAFDGMSVNITAPAVRSGEVKYHLFSGYGLSREIRATQVAFEESAPMARWASTASRRHIMLAAIVSKFSRLPLEKSSATVTFAPD
jgi:hypothetical protein